MIRSPLLLRCGLILGMLSLGGCDPERNRSGTSVGNPGSSRVRLAPSEGITLEGAEVDALEIQWIGCDGGFTSLADGPWTWFDDAVIEIPGGPGCGVAVQFGSPLWLAGSSDDPPEATFEGAIHPQAGLTLWAASSIEVDEDTFVLEIGAPDWLDPDGLGLEEGVDRGFDEGDEIAAWLEAQIYEDSALFADPDASGDIDATERQAGPIASTQFAAPVGLGDTGRPSPQRVSVEGCGCTTPTPGGGGGLLLVLVLWIRARTGSGSRGGSQH